MEAEEPPPRRGGALRMTLSEGQSCRITAMSLVDPDAARGQPRVRAWVQVGDEQHTIGTLCPEQPIASVRTMELYGGDGGGEFLLCHDSAWSCVRFYGYYLDPPGPHGEGEPTRRQYLVDVHAEEMGDEEEVELEPAVEYEPLTEEDLAERYDSDINEDEDEEGDAVDEDADDDDGDGDEEEEDLPRKISNGEMAGEGSKRRNSTGLVAAPGRGIVVPDGVFLGPARFAAVKNTAGFMQIASAEDGSASQEGKEIVVLYRYTRFSRTWSGQRGVEACRRTKLHWLRFAVPPAGDMASSLAWAGSSLSPLIYPGLFRRQLQDLWSSLAAPATTTAATIPLQATRLQVIVDVGILRREDHTAERMEYMRDALEAIMGEAWPEYYHVGMELNLPELVWREDDGGAGEDNDERPTKRRRVAAKEPEECSLCLDPLENDLAAWPGCGHEFHGECMEKTLARSDMCPLCRRKLSDALVCEAIQSS